MGMYTSRQATSTWISKGEKKINKDKNLEEFWTHFPFLSLWSLLSFPDSPELFQGLQLWLVSECCKILK